MSTWTWMTRSFPRKVEITAKDMQHHIFICGQTGSGKTTTMFRILQKFKSFPFLIIEPSTAQYRALLKLPEFKDVKVFTVGDRLSPITYNPFYIQHGVSFDTHLNCLNSIFRMALSSCPTCDQIVKKCIPKIYKKRGWDDKTGSHPALKTKEDYLKTEHKYYFPTINDLIDEVMLDMKDSEWDGDGKARIKGLFESSLRALQSGPMGRIFNTYDFYSFDSLFNEQAVLEFKFGRGSEECALVMYVILALANEYLVANRPNNTTLRHFTVIEEAHNLIDNNIQKGQIGEYKSNPKGEVAKACEDMLAEWRKYGEGLCIIEQAPTKISEYVIKNAHTKIVHELDAKDEAELMKKYLRFVPSISSCIRSGETSIGKLKSGEFWIRKHEEDFPTKTHTDNSSFKHLDGVKVTDDFVEEHMTTEASQVRNELYYLYSNTTNKSTLDQITIKLIYSASVFGNSYVAELIDRYKHAIKQNVTYLNYSEEYFNLYLTQIICEQLVKLGVVVDGKFMTNIPILLDDSMRKSVNLDVVELHTIDLQYAKQNLRQHIKNETNQQEIARKLDNYLFQVDTEKFAEITNQLIRIQ